MAVYSLSFIFYGLPEGSFELSLSGIMNILKSNILMSVLSVGTALSALLSSNKKLTNEVASEMLKANTKIERYEYDKKTGDVIVKIYKRVGKRSIRKAILVKVLTKVITTLFSVGVLALLVYLLSTM